MDRPLRTVTPWWRDRRRLALAAGALGLGAALVTLGGAGASFTASTSSGATVTAASLDPYAPASVTAARVDGSTCRVTWTASAAASGSAPAGLHYDVLDGTTALATDVAGTTADLATTGDVTARVRARVGSWVSSAQTVAGSSCQGRPSAPTALVVSPGDGQLSGSWTAPASDGGSAVTGYTLTVTPPAGSTPGGPVTCTTTAPGTGCTVLGLTNGVTYAVTVTAANTWGPGPAAAAVPATPYPALLASSAAKVWLDAQQSTSLFTTTGGSTNTAAGGVVQRWADRSSNGWNAVKPATSGSPTLVASAINGKPAVRFDRTHPDYLEVTNAGIGAVGSADRSMFAVATARTSASPYSSNDAGAIAVWQGYHTGIIADGYPTITQVHSEGWTSGPANLRPAAESITSPFIAMHRGSSSGGVLTVGTAVNGRPTGTQSASGSWYGYGDTLRLGTGNPTGGASQHLDGDIGELIVLNRAVTATEQRQVEEYLANGARRSRRGHRERSPQPSRPARWRSRGRLRPGTAGRRSPAPPSPRSLPTRRCRPAPARRPASPAP